MIGGAVGALLRYLVSMVCDGVGWVGTAVVNCVGCFVLGMIMALVMRWHGFEQTVWYYFLTVGLCGSFTTFSTMVKEASGMGAGGNWLVSAVYVGLSVVVGLVLFRIGSKVVEMF